MHTPCQASASRAGLSQRGRWLDTAALPCYGTQTRPLKRIPAIPLQALPHALRTATYRRPLFLAAVHCYTSPHAFANCYTVVHGGARWCTLLHTTTHCCTLLLHCYGCTLQHTATQNGALRRIAMHRSHCCTLLHRYSLLMLHTASSCCTLLLHCYSLLLSNSCGYTLALTALYCSLLHPPQCTAPHGDSLPVSCTRR